MFGARSWIIAKADCAKHFGESYAFSKDSLRSNCEPFVAWRRGEACLGQRDALAIGVWLRQTPMFPIPTAIANIEHQVNGLDGERNMQGDSPAAPQDVLLTLFALLFYNLNPLEQTF